MILKILYPDELKSLITSLKSEGDYNEQTIKNLNRHLLVNHNITPVLIVCFLASFMVHISYVFLIFCGLSIIIFIEQLITARTKIMPAMIAYIKGERRKGIVKRAVGSRGNNAVIGHIEVIDTETQELISVGSFGKWDGLPAPWTKKSKRYELCPKKGSEFFYYTWGEEKKVIVPDCPRVKKLLCLSKSMLR